MKMTNQYQHVTVLSGPPRFGPVKQPLYALPAKPSSKPSSNATKPAKCVGWTNIQCILWNPQLNKVICKHYIYTSFKKQVWATCTTCAQGWSTWCHTAAPVLIQQMLHTKLIWQSTHIYTYLVCYKASKTGNRKSHNNTSTLQHLGGCSSPKTYAPQTICCIPNHHHQKQLPVWHADHVVLTWYWYIDTGEF